MKSTRAPAATKAVVSERRQSHRADDIGGIVMLVLAFVIGIALAARNAGLLGLALSGFFVTLFGQGAWGIPLLCTIIGISLIAGQRRLELNRWTWGLACIYVSVVAALAKSIRGDLFDPEIVKTSGGYLGAMVSWLFGWMLGEARAVGIGALAMIGAVLCINAPLRQMLPKKKAGIEKKQIKREEKPDPTLPSRKDALRAAIAQMGDEVEAKVTPAKTQSLKTQAPNPKTVSLATDVPMPKEGYQLPPLTLLSESASRPKRTAAEMQQNIETLESTLEEFGIEANVVEVAAGPTITRYEIQLGPGIRVGRISALGDNIAMNLAASHVRVEAPIPGKAAVGVEVPNAQASMVSLREVADSHEFMNAKGRLTVTLGQDVAGNNRYADLTKMPHLLIGGATNSGKSIGLATIITSLLMRNTPKDLRLVMIDPKRVELSLFDGIPHLMCPVVKDVKEAPGVLRAVWREMDVRYDRLSEAGVRNIDGWNEKVSFAERLPYIVVIIDELADLMIQASAEVETSIVRLAQLARAVGIHLVIATQRPSVDVITGTIKANIPSRMAFSVSSHIDSRTILDQAGAERLVGKGDMLFMPIDANKPTRIQGCYVSEKEIEEVCKFWCDQEAPHYVLNPIGVAIADKEREIAEQEDDPLWQESVRFVVSRNQGSTSMLQRKFSIGFQRASRLLDMMEERGIVGPKDGSRPREILVDMVQVEQMFGGGYYDGPDLGDIQLSDQDER